MSYTYNRTASGNFSDEELAALSIMDMLKPGYRARQFDYVGLGEYTPENPTLQSLIKKGLVKIQGGKNIVLDKGKAKDVMKRHAPPSKYKNRLDNYAMQFDTSKKASTEGVYTYARTAASIRLRKGQLLRRKNDGFVFSVETVSQAKRGAVLQCVDALRIFGWWSFAAIARDFEPVDTKTAASTTMRAGMWYYQKNTAGEMWFLAEREQKNEGFAGKLVTWETRNPKSKKTSVPKSFWSLWKEIPKSEVPQEVLDAV